MGVLPPWLMREEEWKEEKEEVEELEEEEWEERLSAIIGS